MSGEVETAGSGARSVARSGVRSAGRAAERLLDVSTRLFGPGVPVRISAWDGSRAGPVGAPLVSVRSRRALRRLLWRPDELGLARAYVAGEIDVDEPLVALFERLEPWVRSVGPAPSLDGADRRELLRTAVVLGAVGPEPKPPTEETGGPLPALEPEVVRLIVGDGEPERNGSVEPGTLDLSGSAGESASGLAGSLPQAYDRIIGLGEPSPVGSRELDTAVLQGLLARLRPGGTLACRVVVRRGPAGRRVLRAYIGTSGVLPTLAQVVTMFEDAGFEVTEIGSARAELAARFRAWTTNLEAHWEKVVSETSPGRARLMLLLLAGVSVALQGGDLGAYRITAVRPPERAGDSRDGGPDPTP